MPSTARVEFSASTPLTASHYNNLLSAAVGVFWLQPNASIWSTARMASGLTGDGGVQWLQSACFFPAPASSQVPRSNWYFMLSCMTATTATIAYEMVRFYGNTVAFNTGSANTVGWTTSPTGTAYTCGSYSQPPSGLEGNHIINASGISEAAAGSAIWDMGSIVTGRLVVKMPMQTDSNNTGTASALWQHSPDNVSWADLLRTAYITYRQTGGWLILPETGARYLRFLNWRVAAAVTARIRFDFAFFTASAITTVPANAFYWESESAYPSSELLALLQSGVAETATARVLSGWVLWR